MTTANTKTRLKAAGYLEIKIVNRDRWIGLRRFLNGFAIVRGNLVHVEPETFWYKDYEVALKALKAFTGTGSPDGFISKFTLKGKTAWDAPVR